MKKNIIWLLIVGALIIAMIYFMSNNKQQQEGDDKQQQTSNFVSCLSDAGVVIYGSFTCPACTSLANEFGGYDKIETIFIECSQSPDRCNLEMQTNYVPEIQIKGEVFPINEWSLERLAVKTNCEL